MYIYRTYILLLWRASLSFFFASLRQHSYNISLLPSTALLLHCIAIPPAALRLASYYSVRSIARRISLWVELLSHSFPTKLMRLSSFVILYLERSHWSICLFRLVKDCLIPWLAWREDRIAGDEYPFPQRSSTSLRKGSQSKPLFLIRGIMIRVEGKLRDSRGKSSRKRGGSYCKVTVSSSIMCAVRLTTLYLCGEAVYLYTNGAVPWLSTHIHAYALNELPCFHSLMQRSFLLIHVGFWH